MPDPAPTTASAMKAVLTDARFSDPDWIFERKLDGIRCIAIRDGGPVKLLSRNDLSLNGRYPGIVAELEADPRTRFAIDGEVVAFEGAQTSFQRLSQADASIFYYVFDVLWLDGEDVRDRALRERKRLLKKALRFQHHVRLTAYRNEAGEALFAEACAKGWEGVIAKRADSVYTAKRSKDWLKFKCEQGQELVIGGFTAPRGSREEFGALLVGHFDARRRPALRRQGRHRLRPQDAQGPRHPHARARARHHAVRRLPPLSRRHLGRARARRPARLLRMDDRRAPAPPAGSSACAWTNPPHRSSARRRRRASDAPAVRGSVAGAAGEYRPDREGGEGADPLEDARVRRGLVVIQEWLHGAIEHGARQVVTSIDHRRPLPDNSTDRPA